jgi:hypothetical protein
LLGGMKRLALLAALAACGGSSKSSTPPTPEAPTCAVAAAKMIAIAGDDMLGPVPDDKRPEWKVRFETVVATSCTEDEWAPALRTCIGDATTTEAIDTCGKQLTDDQKSKLMGRFEAPMTDLMKELNAGKPPEAAAPVEPIDEAWLARVRSMRTSLPECDAYLKTFADYLGCDKVPEAARSASKQGLDAMMKSMATFAEAAAEDRKAAADACRQGRDGLIESAKALGCKL